MKTFKLLALRQNRPSYTLSILQSFKLMPTCTNSRNVLSNTAQHAQL